MLLSFPLFPSPSFSKKTKVQRKPKKKLEQVLLLLVDHHTVLITVHLTAAFSNSGLAESKPVTQKLKTFLFKSLNTQQNNTK